MACVTCFQIAFDAGNLPFFSFFLNHEESFIEFNSNILETNLINILLLIGLLVYANKTSFGGTLANRQTVIIQTIENAQKDVIDASNYFEIAENSFKQSFLFLQSWKEIYEKEKIEIVLNKYKVVKIGLEENFLTTENLINNIENKAFLSLKRYLILVTASTILKKFLFLSEKEQTKLIEDTIAKIGGTQK